MADRSLMSVLAAGVRKEAGPSMVTDIRPLLGYVREPFAGAWQRNMELKGLGDLLSYSPIYACVTRIAGDIAKLSIDLLADDGTGIWEPAPKTSPYWQVLRRPNNFQNRIQFIRHWILAKLLFGSAKALKGAFDQRGICTALYLLDPRSTRPMVTEEGDVYYSASSSLLARLPVGAQAIPARLMIDDRGPTPWNELIGVPPLFACALSGTLGLKIQQNSSAFFGNQSRPSGFLTGPKTIDPITASRLKEQWENNYSGQNLGRTAVLGDNLTYSAMTVAAEQSQLAEQLGLSAIDVATAFGMPAYKINQGPMPTNNNVEALAQEYYDGALQGLIEDLEICLTEGLGVPDGYRVEFNLDGLLRMDSATKMEALAKGVGSAILKPNEARRSLNRRGATGGDELFLQEQNYSLSAIAKRDAKTDPFSKAAPVKEATPAAPAPAPAPEKTVDAFALLMKGLDELV